MSLDISEKKKGMAKMLGQKKEIEMRENKGLLDKMIGG